MELVCHYPDVECEGLRRALAEAEGVPIKSIICGNGAADLIFGLALALKPGKALLPAPTFAEYEQALRACGCETEYYFLSEEEGFCPGEGFLDHIGKDTDMVFFCNPNNPTGVAVEPEYLKKLAHRCRETETFLVLDECFEDFLTDRTHSLIPDLADHHLLILRAFTKFYGLAGVRLGYCLSRETGLLAAMAAAGQPWPVSNLAQAAGIAALKERAYGETLRALITTQRQVLFQGLTALGCQVVPGEANYLLFRAPTQDLGRRLAHRGILLRSCANYTGLDAHWFRTAVRSPEENALLLQAMKEALP